MKKNNITIELKSAQIENTVIPMVQESLKQGQSDMIEYFLEATQARTIRKSEWQQEKKKVQDMYNRLNAPSKKNLLNIYLEAYELILQVRKFFLGELGVINYEILFSDNTGEESSIKTIKLSSEYFSNLINNENQSKFFTISESKGVMGIRFTSEFFKNLKAKIEIPNDQSFYEITFSDGLGQKFTKKNVFLQYIQTLRELQYHYYSFIFQKILGKQQKIIIQYVNGRPKSTSVFSAIGKYAYDEIEAKKQAVIEMRQQGFKVKDYKGSLNIGNLSEIYVLAKARINNNKNKFKEGRRAVQGKTLYEIFSQVRKNKDPFYSGGDVLDFQIKSYIGALPSLTTFSAINKAINKIYEIFKLTDEEKIKESLIKIFTQEQTSLLKEANQLSKNLTNTIQKLIIENI